MGEREAVRAAMEADPAFNRVPDGLADHIAVPPDGPGRWSLRRGNLSMAFAAAFVLVAAVAMVTALRPGGLWGTQAPRGEAAPTAQSVPQDLTFTGALTDHWTSAQVTQCEVQPVTGPAGGERVYQVFLRAPIHGVTYDLTLHLIGYHGPGTYVASPETTGPPAPPAARIPPGGPPGSAAPVQGGRFTPSAITATPISNSPGTFLATLYRSPPKAANALSEVDDESVASVTVADGEDRGTIQATFGPVTFRLPLVMPADSLRVHLSGNWSCGRFPIVPVRSPRPSPS